MGKVYDPDGLFRLACVGGVKFDTDRTALLQPGLTNATSQVTRIDTESSF